MLSVVTKEQLSTGTVWTGEIRVLTSLCQLILGISQRTLQALNNESSKQQDTICYCSFTDGENGGNNSMRLVQSQRLTESHSQH